MITVRNDRGFSSLLQVFVIITVGILCGFKSDKNRKSILFVSYVVSDIQFKQSLNLCESIRTFAGDMSQTPIRIYISGNLREETEQYRDNFARLSVELRFINLPPEALKYAFGFKPSIAGLAEKDAEDEYDRVVFLDANILIIDEPRDFVLEGNKRLAYRPVMHQNIGSLYSEEPDAFWSALYQKLHVKENALFPMETIADKKTLRPYFNAGLLVVRPEMNVLRKWDEYFGILAGDPQMAEMCKDGTHNIFLHQAALVGAVLNNVQRDEMLLLPFAYNYPIFFEKFYGSEKTFDSIEGIISIKYEFSVNKLPEDWDQKLKGPERVVSWLKGKFADCRGAVAQDVTVKQVVLGTKYTIHSEILGDDRSFVVNLPEGYESTGLRYPVLYILDAEYFYYQAHGALQFLSECGYNNNRPVPQMILVAVLDGDRNRDFTATHAPVQGPLRYPTSGGAAAYLEHVEKELRPFIDANFRTSGSILAGWSFGGLFTFYTFLEKPGLFAAYIAISPSLWWNNQEPLGWAGDRISDGADFRQRLVITQGSLEGGNIGNSVKGGIVPLLEKKKAQGWTYVEIPGVSHNYTPYKALYEGLRAAFPGFAVPQNELNEGLAAVREHYAALSAGYGYTVNVPDDAYAALVRGWFNSHAPGEILPITAEWTETYPGSALAWYFHGRMYQLSNDLDKARACFEKALALEEARVLPDSEWLNPMRERLKEVSK